ncbi:MAG: ComF family protein [Patescibacteria group bacterium]
MRQTLKQFFNWLVEALFPQRCAGCGQFNDWACPLCLAELTYPRQLTCPTCGANSPVGEFCENCNSNQSLNGLWCSQSYSNRLIKKLISGLKYQFLTAAVPILGQILITTLRVYNLPPPWHATPRSNWFLVPVPLAKWRARERGFNQAALLAQVVSEAANLQIADIIERTRGTQPQSKITDPAKRRQNLQNVFKLKAGIDCQNQVYILVDDVYTSGATLQECAKLLKAAGAMEVWGLTVAKG